MRTITLFRPMGNVELDLIRDTGWTSFSPRLSDQPFFYPVLNEQYATQIARDWNTKDGGTGHVVCFDVAAEFLARYDVQTVGSSSHQEYWIPASELKEFNRNLLGPIRLVSTFGPSTS